MKLQTNCKLLVLLIYMLRIFMCVHSFQTEMLTNISKENHLAEQLSDYIFLIAKTYATREDLVHFVLPREEDDTRIIKIMDTTLRKISKFWTVTTNDSVCCDSVEEWHIPYVNKAIEYIQALYIIPVYQDKTTEHFEAQLEVMSREDSFNPRAMFILVQLTDQCYQVNQNADRNAKIFNTMWSLHLFNASLLIISNCDLALTVVTARPFSEENQCRTVNVDGLKYHHLPQGARALDIDLFQHKIIKDFQGCTFWAGTVPYPPYVVGEAFRVDNETRFSEVRGIDIELIRTFSSKMNANFKFYQSYTFGMDAWVTVLDNGTIIGFVQDLLEHKIDITFGGVMPSYVTSYKLDYSNTYKFSTLNLFVPDADILPPWLIFLKVFSVKVWILSAFTFVLVTLVFHLMSFHTLKHIDISLAELFKLCIGFSSTLNPKRLHSRILFFSWAVYCVHWYIAYTTMMFLLLTDPPHDKEILTFKDLKNSGFKVSVNAIYLEVFGHIQIDRTTTSVLRNHLICPDIEVCVDQFVKHRNFSIMGTAETLEYLLNWQQSKIHKLPENVLTFSVSFLTNKGNPLTEPVSMLTLHTLQAGLLLKWEKDAGRFYRLRNKATEPEERSVVLDLKGAFYILMIGKAVAFIVFLTEIMIECFRKPNKVI